MKTKSYTHGKLPQAEHILPALYELMESDESVKETPPPAAPSSNTQAMGRYWDEVKEALTTSLTTGTFLDSQFYAVESRSSTGSPKIRPIYLCSTVGRCFGLSIPNLVACEPLARIMCAWVTELAF